MSSPGWLPKDCHVLLMPSLEELCSFTSLAAQGLPAMRRKVLEDGGAASVAWFQRTCSGLCRASMAWHPRPWPEPGRRVMEEQVQLPWPGTQGPVLTLGYLS